MNPTPTPVPVGEVVESVTRLTDSFQSLGFNMAALFVVALALGIMFLIFWGSRNSNTTVITLLSRLIAQKDKELEEQRAMEQQRHDEYIESLSAITEQSTRANDLFEAMNNRGLERDKQQQQSVGALETLVHEGSLPLRVVAQDVSAVMKTISELDTRTSNWQAVMDSIPVLRAELNNRMDLLLIELKKRSTKPIPKVEPIIDVNGLSEENKGTP